MAVDMFVNDTNYVRMKDRYAWDKTFVISASIRVEPWELVFMVRLSYPLRRSANMRKAKRFRMRMLSEYV